MNFSNRESSPISIHYFNRARAVSSIVGPLCLIWGLQWCINAVLQYIWIWPYQDWVMPATVIPALVATLFVWVRSSQRQEHVLSSFHTTLIFITLAMILGTVVWLQYIQAINLFFAPVFHTLLLSIAFIIFGGWTGKQIGRSFIYIGIWLFILTLIISYFYIGFTHFILGGFGGLSLLMSRWILIRWFR